VLALCHGENFFVKREQIKFISFAERRKSRIRVKTTYNEYIMITADQLKDVLERVDALRGYL